MGSHSHDLWNDGLIRPLDTKDFRKLLEVMGCSFTDRENGVTQPGHTECCQFLVKELDTELTCQKRDVLDNRQSNSPLLVLGKLDNCRE